MNEGGLLDKRKMASALEWHSLQGKGKESRRSLLAFGRKGEKGTDFWGRGGGVIFYTDRRGREAFLGRKGGKFGQFIREGSEAGEGIARLRRRDFVGPGDDIGGGADYFLVGGEKRRKRKQASSLRK